MNKRCFDVTRSVKAYRYFLHPKQEKMGKNTSKVPGMAHPLTIANLYTSEEKITMCLIPRKQLRTTFDL